MTEEQEHIIEAQDFDLKQFLFRYLRYWYVFVVAVIIALGAAWFYNWYAQPVFAISSKVLIKDEISSPAHAIMQDLEMTSKNKNLENEIEILRSHRMVGKALEQLEFEVSYNLVGNIKTSEIYTDCPFRIEVDSVHHFAFFTSFSVHLLDERNFEWSYELEGEEPYSGKGKIGDWFSFPLGTIKLWPRSHFTEWFESDPAGEKRRFKILFHGSERLIQQYVNKLSIEPISGQSTIVQIALLDAVPQKGVDFLNALVNVYLQNDVNEKNRTADNTSVFIGQQLEKITTDLTEIEAARETYKTTKGIIDLSAESQVVLETARKIDEKIAANNARKSMVSNLKEYVSNEQKLSELAPSTIDLNDPLLVSLVERLHRLEIDWERVSVGSTPRNPEFAGLQAELRLTRQKIIENITNIEKNIDLTNLQLEEESRQIRSRIQGIPKTERELIGIERQYRIQESLYLYLLEKQAEVSISLASSVSDNRVVDSARASGSPVKPVKSKAYAIGLILGLLVPFFVIYLRDQLDDTVRDVSTIERLTQLPIIGVVGLHKDESNLVISENLNSPVAEAYRAVRTNINFFGTNGQQKVLLITSSIGTEGKTFTAMNLSSVLAISGKRTILLGLDLRKPKIVDDFNMSNEKGISTFLSGQHDLDEVIQPSQLTTGFDVIPSGPVPPNPSELIMGPRMDELIDALSERYDHVVIDSPPVGLVTDGLMLIKYAALTIYVVRQGVTRKQHLRNIQSIQQQQQGKMSILFNAVKKSALYGYSGYGYQYGYGNDYGYYSGEGQPRGWRGRLRSLFTKLR